MNKNQDIEQRRALWLATVKTITEKCFTREAKLADLCPQRLSLDQETKAQALKSIARISREISIQVNTLTDIEKSGGLGFSVVLGHAPDELTSIVMCLLISARLDNSVTHLLRCVSDVMNQASVRNPSSSLRVRNMFRSDSEIFNFVGLGRGIARDELSVSLRESILNRILSQPSDAIEVKCEAELLVGKGR